MELKKAEIEDLNTVVKLKMDMFTEVGSADLLPVSYTHLTLPTN